jgi:CheY-like chemotaxis protein
MEQQEKKKQLGTLLVDLGIITTKTLERALERQKGSGRKLGAVLEDMGVVNEEELIDALARQIGFKTAKGFAGYPFPADVLGAVHEDLAIQKGIFPLKLSGGVLAIAVSDPFDASTFDYLTKKTGYKILPVLSTRKEITAAINGHYLRGREGESELQKVLVVDDSDTITKIIAVALEKEGYSVKEASDGIEGLKLAIAEKPDLIICDSVMPRMDGFALMRALRANPVTADIPAILLTSKASGEDEQRAFDSGFLDFVPKPVQPIRIVSRVKHAFSIINAMKKQKF